MTTSMTRRRFNTGMAGLTATAALGRSIGPAAAETSELWSLPASEVARLVRTRKVSAREVADSALQRLDSVNPRITAIVDCRPDLVREQADRVDSVLASENDPGPLAGVPVTVKLTLTRQGLPRAMAAGCKKTSSP